MDYSGCVRYKIMKKIQSRFSCNVTEVQISPIRVLVSGFFIDDFTIGNKIVDSFLKVSFRDSKSTFF